MNLFFIIKTNPLVKPLNPNFLHSNFKILNVDWSCRGETPAGCSGRGETTEQQSCEVGSPPPRGKRIPAAEINDSLYQCKFDT